MSEGILPSSFVEDRERWREAELLRRVEVRNELALRLAVDVMKIDGVTSPTVTESVVSMARKFRKFLAEED